MDGNATARTRAVRLERGGAGDGETITLRHEERHRRRAVLQSDGGGEVLLDLPEAVEMRDGDVLVLEDGRRIAIRAAAEPLLEVRATSPHHLARLAWHLGNRHLPVAIEADRIFLRPDHVIAGMLRGLGAEVSTVEAPFQPEGGAYGGGHGHGHG